MMAHSLRTVSGAVLLVCLAAATHPIPAAAQDRPGPASVCSTVTQISPAECNALAVLYTSTNGAGWTHRDGWLATQTPCSWYGVSCDAEGVATLDLNTNHLSGSIPPELAGLANLHVLDLDTNQLSGGIPPELGDLDDLLGLDLDTNQLSGGIPRQLGSLASLQALNLSENPLDGSIPAELGNLVALQHLYLGSDRLSGSIPAQLGSLAKLQTLDLESNRLSGSIPPQLGSLAKLQNLLLNSNQLAGSLPQSLTNLHELSNFYFDTARVCVPNNATFAAWFAGIANKSPGAVRCDTWLLYLPALKRK